MVKYILKRLLSTIPILFGTLLVTFVLFHMSGYDPAVELAGKKANPREIESKRAEFGFDKPLFFSH